MAPRFKGKRGDLIEIFRGPYQHWVVYIGENEVVHLDTEEHTGGDSSSSLELLSANAQVKREKFAKVVGNDLYKVNNLLDNSRKAREPNVIVKEACAMVGRKLQYNLVDNNCKHFATEMRYGVAVSLQFNGKKGDLIEINRGLYKHWAVYIGENEVVHFTTDGVQSSSSSESLSSRGEVKREKFTDVVGIHRHCINNLLDNTRKPRDPSIIVKKACAMVGCKLEYDLVNYNCEHFATKMRYGEAESRQCNGKPGDLIEIFRLAYQHWAVYIGGNEVVHFGPDGGLSSSSSESLSSSTGNVLLQNFAYVVASDFYRVNNLQDDRRKAREPSVIVEEALAKVGRELQYNLATYNCEHFAKEMRYGVAESQQVNKALDVVVSTIAGVSSWSAASSSCSSK